MGRIKTTLIKRTTHELMKRHGDDFTEDFEGNKKIVDRLISTPSKKLRNTIAGYATRIVKKKKEGRISPKIEIETDYGNI